MITYDQFSKFIHLATTRLEGEWIIIGSAVLVALNSRTRHTEDIDFVNLNFKTESLPIWQIAEELGLQVEQINLSAGYFLSKIPDFKHDCKPFFSSDRLTIYIPNMYLFFKLKLARFSETDALDCLEYLELTKENESIDFDRLVSIVEENKGSKKIKNDLLAKLFNLRN